MKKSLSLLFLVFCATLSAQNLQVHYDFGKNRNYVTTTFEMFKSDTWGNTFMFVDFDYNMGKENHPSLAYTEIARCFTIAKSPFSAQLEYNGGLLVGGNSIGFPINNAYLAGLDYGWHSEDFSKLLNFKVLYKYIAGKNPHSFQLTGVWTLNFFENKLTFGGFADFWKEDNLNFSKPSGKALASPKETKFVFLSEPQLWFNATDNLSLGSELEIASNFGTIAGVKFSPTIAVKWSF